MKQPPLEAVLFHGLEVHGLEEYAERLRQAGREYFYHVYIQIVCKANALNGVHEPDADRRKVLRASGETAYNIHRGDIRRRLVHAVIKRRLVQPSGLGIAAGIGFHLIRQQC